MRKKRSNMTIGAAAAIAVVITALTLTAVILGEKNVMASENRTAEKKQEKFTDDILERYRYQPSYDIAVLSWFNDETGGTITAVMNSPDGDTEELLELYINYDQVELRDPLASITTGLDQVFGTSTEESIIAYCQANDIDYDTDALSEIGSEQLFDLIDEIQADTGVTL